MQLIPSDDLIQTWSDDWLVTEASRHVALPVYIARRAAHWAQQLPANDLELFELWDSIKDEAEALRAVYDLGCEFGRLEVSRG